jgi:hypothetical protein
MSTPMAIALIQALHTAVFVVVSACIVYVLGCGLAGRARAVLFYPALVAPIAVGAFWLANGRECLLSSAIYRLAGGDRSVPDIFLPGAVSRWIMPVSAAFMAIGGSLALWRTLAGRWRGPNGKRSAEIL